jgi:hypothetical protein
VDRPADSLPDHIDALRALALKAIAERDAAIVERDRLITMNEKLRQLLRNAHGFEARASGWPCFILTSSLALENWPRRSRKSRRPPMRRGNGGSIAAHETAAPAETKCPLLQQADAGDR